MQTTAGRDRLEEDETSDVSENVSEMTEIVESDVNERAKVESWRLHVLIEAGYPLPLAERLAVSEADLHQAVALVQSGCNHTVAAEILL